MSIYVDIEKKFSDFHLQVHFEGNDEVIALLGASGCGKTMTLKCIAGIETPDRGKIILNGKTLFDSEKHINLSPQKRRVGLLFQNYALFPNMTVVQNITAGTRRDKHVTPKEKITDIMERFELTDVADHYPHQLSGGQQQRTALARILISQPEILLLDEPFSALDSHLRFRVEQEVRQVIKEFGKTVLFVSHSRDEVFRLSHKIAILHNGKIDVFGKKECIFSNPMTRNAAILTGCKNISPIEKIDEHHLIALDWNLELETDQTIGDSRFVGIRMHSISHGTGDNTHLCNVTDVIENPFSYTVMLQTCDSVQTFGWELDKSLWQHIQASKLHISIKKNGILLLK